MTSTRRTTTIAHPTKKSRKASSSNAAATVAWMLCFCWSAPLWVSAFSAPPSQTMISLQLWLPPLRVSASADNNSMGYGGSASASSPFENQAQPAATWPVAPQKSALLDWDWRAVVQEAWVLDPRPIVMFDGDCNLCSGAVNRLLDMDTTNEFRFCSLSSKFGASLLVAHGKEPDDKNSIMVIVRTGEITNDGFVESHFLQKSDAVMVIASRLQGAPSWVRAMTALGTVAPAAVSNWLLQIIADNRYRVAGPLEESSCRLDLDGEYEGRFLNDYEHMHLFQPLDGGDAYYS